MRQAILPEPFEEVDGEAIHADAVQSTGKCSSDVWHSLANSSHDSDTGKINSQIQGRWPTMRKAMREPALPYDCWDTHGNQPFLLHGLRHTNQTIGDGLLTLDRFLEAFSEGITTLAARPAAIDNLSGVRVPAPGQVSIGIGKPADGETDDGVGICLNNKAYGHHAYRSVTSLVLNGPDELKRSWRQALAASVAPREFFGSSTLLVEDASPDSCFGLLCFLALMNGVDPNQIPSVWVNHIEAWERDGMDLGEDYETTYGILHNSLVHSTIDRDPAAAWTSGLRLLVDALAHGEDPLALQIREMRAPATKRARTLLQQEMQSYAEEINAAEKIQLRLPLAADPRRYRTIDAAIGQEDALVKGSSKVFLRNDRSAPCSKTGYGLIVIHRPNAVGSGNDITVSLDSRLGLSLLEFWHAIEAAEDNAWGGARPNGNPRRQTGYPEGVRPDGTPSPTQPWYMDPDFSLVAAPKKIDLETRDSVPGSRLSFQQVMEILWTTYSPLNGVKFKSGSKAVQAITSTDGVGGVPFEQLIEEPQDTRPAGTVRKRRRYVAEWLRPNNQSSAFVWTPTLGRLMAAKLKRKLGDVAPIRLADLPSASSHSTFQFPEGAIVASEDGAFLLLSESANSLPIAEIIDEMNEIDDLLEKVDRLAGTVGKTVEDALAFLQGRTVSGARSSIEMFNQLAAEQLELMSGFLKADVSRRQPLSTRVRAHLMESWGIKGKLEDVYRRIEDVKGILIQHTEMVTNRRVSFLTIYGFPIALAATLFGFVFSGISPLLSQTPLSGTNWMGLGLFVLLSAAGIFAMRVYVRRSDRRSTIQKVPPER